MPKSFNDTPIDQNCWCYNLKNKMMTILINIRDVNYKVIKRESFQSLWCEEVHELLLICGLRIIIFNSYFAKWIQKFKPANSDHWNCEKLLPSCPRPFFTESTRVCLHADRKEQSLPGPWNERWLKSGEISR